MKTYKKFIAVIAIQAFLMTSFTVNAAASQEFKKLCNDAEKNVLTKETPPQNFLESYTVQDPGSKLVYEGGLIYSIPDDTPQKMRVKELARIAFLTGAKVSLCLDISTSPYTIWMIEITK